MKTLKNSSSSNLTARNIYKPACFELYFNISQIFWSVRNISWKTLERIIINTRRQKTKTSRRPCVRFHPCWKTLTAPSSLSWKKTAAPQPSQCWKMATSFPGLFLIQTEKPWERCLLRTHFIARIFSSSLYLPFVVCHWTILCEIFLELYLWQI